MENDIKHISFQVKDDGESIRSSVDKGAEEEVTDCLVVNSNELVIRSQRRSMKRNIFVPGDDSLKLRLYL